MLHSRRPFLRVLLNPLVVCLVVVLAIVTGWLLYIGGATSTAEPRPGANLFPALDPPSADQPSVPAGAVGGWVTTHSGDAQTSLELVDGQLSDRAVEFDVSHVVSGEVSLTSPRVDVEPGSTYLFKAFTTSDADFTLLLRRHHVDGSTTLEQLPAQLERPSDSPFTVSDAFESAGTTVAVEYVFRLASKGTFRVQGAYLEAANDIRLPPSAAPAPNLIPNSGLAGPPLQAPKKWSAFDTGTSTVNAGRSEDEDGSFLWTRVENYHSGEAKWQYQPIPVSTDRYFRFGATYQSEREVDVVAEFELADGGRVFRHLATAPPAGDWTKIHEEFQAPEGAQTAMVTLVSRGNGTTGVRDYSLSDITKPGDLRWDQPRVSISFDDGWRSVFEHALPLLNEHGFRSTQYVNTSSIETPDFMTAAQLQQMHEAGHEIASHSDEHIDLTSIEVNRLEAEMRKGQESLADAGVHTRNLAPPYGRSDPQVDWYASKYYDIMRGTDEGLNTRQNLEPHDLKVFYVTEETTPEELSDALAEASRVNGWLILVYHQIADSKSTSSQKDTIPADGSTIATDLLAAQLKVIDESGIEVQPVGTAFDQLHKK